MNEIPSWVTEKRKGGPGRPRKYPLDTMELYAVHTVAPEDVPPSGLSTFRVMLCAQARKLDRKFACRQIESGAIEICRVK